MFLRCIVGKKIPQNTPYHSLCNGRIENERPTKLFYNKTTQSLLQCLH
ncbi:hypothetical protein DOY81_010829 [Sarcophaga bullata]|nr:hypothetical protein DOY81_010829 [Sarcophaga bullata]